jgi:RNA polymerase sigma-70 factor (ECF subfamily)
LDVPVRITEPDLRAAQRGDPSALSLVYGQLAPAVLGYLTAKGAADPEALTSEVFLSLFRRLPSVSGGVAGLRTLTFTIAHARAVDDARRAAREPDTVPYEPALDRRTGVSAEDVAVARFGRSRILDLLRALPRDQAEVLILRVLSDLSVSQTGQVMQRSPGAVKQLQRRALLSLRHALLSEAVTE